jgi:amidase
LTSSRLAGSEPPFPSIRTLHAQLRAGSRSSEQLTRQCLDRITELNDELNAVLVVDPTALEQARAADERIRNGRILGALDGIPILIKDNIDTAGLATTCGSRLLTGSPPAKDAIVVSRLRTAGAIILGKTNLTEWANFRSTESTEGWSAVGGQTRNPHLLAHSPGGSSSGSAVAVAVGMAPLALGTDTDGSVVGPAGLCGVVGLKPQPSLLPLDGVCATSAGQDAIGVLGLRVEDVLTALHELSRTPPEPVSLPSMSDLRVGLWQIPRAPAPVQEVMEQLAADLATAGLSTVPFQLAVDQQLLIDGMVSLTSGFRPMIEGYLATRAGAPRTLDELIAANADDPVELALFGQDLFEQAALISEGERRESSSLAERVRVAAVDSIESAMMRYGIDAILAPSNEPAWRVDYELGDPFPLSSSSLSSLACFPNLSIPISAPGDLPIGISIFGPPTVRELAPIALCLESLFSSARQFTR